MAKTGLSPPGADDEMGKFLAEILHAMKAFN